MIAGEPTYTLVDDQLVAFNAVLSMVRRAHHGKRKKNVVVVNGGPATGKSLIALNVLATLSLAGGNVQHATGSKAFTSNLWRVLGSRSKAQVKYFNSFAGTPDDAIDVILADEAHRIRTTSNSRFTPAARRSTLPQVDEPISAARTTVFFIDDYQAVRPGEIGSTALVREAAIRFDARYEQIDLRTQFRCAGSDEYIDWLDQLLEIRKTATMSLGDAQFDFKLVDDPVELDRMIKERVSAGAMARLTGGFCWPWSKPMPTARWSTTFESGRSSARGTRSPMRVSSQRTSRPHPIGQPTRMASGRLGASTPPRDSNSTMRVSSGAKIW
jgi:hypothetical protein